MHSSPPYYIYYYLKTVTHPLSICRPVLLLMLLPLLLLLASPPQVETVFHYHIIAATRCSITCPCTQSKASGASQCLDYYYRLSYTGDGTE